MLQFALFWFLVTKTKENKKIMEPKTETKKYFWTKPKLEGARDSVYLRQVDFYKIVI